MKTLIYGMQSSGASLFAYWLSQQNQCLSIIDLYHDQLAPSLDHDNVVLKCVVTKNILFKIISTLLFLIVWLYLLEIPWKTT